MKIFKSVYAIKHNSRYLHTRIILQLNGAPIKPLMTLRGVPGSSIRLIVQYLSRASHVIILDLFLDQCGRNLEHNRKITQILFSVHFMIVSLFRSGKIQRIFHFKISKTCAWRLSQKSEVLLWPKSNCKHINIS